MGKLACVVEHFEAELKVKDQTIGALTAANAALQAAQTQSAPDLLDVADRAAFARAQARFADLAPATAPAEVPVQAPAKIDEAPFVPSANEAPVSKPSSPFIKPEDPK